MTIHHHPPEELLAAFAAGLLDLGQQLALDFGYLIQPGSVPKDDVHPHRCSDFNSLADFLLTLADFFAD